MKIAFLCPFNLGRFTGTPIRAKITAKALGDKNEVFVVAESGDKGDGLRLVTLGESSFLRFTLKALKTLKVEKPDAIHAFTTVAVISAIVFKYLFSWKTKIVFEMHGWAWYELKGKNIFKRALFLLIDCIGLWLSNKIIAMSHSQANFLKKLTLNKSKIRVVWGSVGKDAVYTAVPERDEIVVGYIGNSSWWQGVGYIIEAAKSISQTNKNIHFKFAGFDYGDQQKFPILSNVTYLGKISDDELKALLIDCDIFVSARLKEKVSELQFPHKLYEYMTAGRPIVASGVSDQELIISTARCGVIVDPTDQKSFMHAILELSLMHKDKREVMGKNAVEYSKDNFSFTAFKSKLDDVYAL